ncbi:hypothetical protein AVEN_124269-1 [Araneus ventricosus]|uniref:Uncharacterized protein n=1 Tax=Araneus ventricosus TaxID=182803 RepID=A0A4Y2WY17_ARAVE|nr:hypothetical protein AVEN_124269-1 [Araneus ventricosus]
MLVFLEGKMVLQKFLLEAKPMNPDLGDKMKLLENARIMTPSNARITERRYGKPSREFYMTSCPVGEAINAKLLKRVNQYLFGLLSAAQAS